MNTKQLSLFDTLIFENISSHKENNIQSQEILEKNKHHFSKQCEIVFTLLMNGVRLTTSKALIGIRVNDKIHKIGDLRRRIKDLKDAGVNISEILNKDRYKVWFMNDDDKNNNKQFLNIKY